MPDTLLPVRILPMDRAEEFPDCNDIKELQEKFFLHEFPRRTDGEYRFHAAGLGAKSGTIVLFQSDGAIIASATLNETKRFSEPYRDDYRGALYFDIRSIRVFDPVPLGVLQSIWPNVKRLGQVKWALIPNAYPAFERVLKNIKAPEI